MSKKYPQVSLSLSANELDKLISYLRPIDQDSHLCKKLRGARDRYDIVVRRVDRAMKNRRLEPVTV